MAGQEVVLCGVGQYSLSEGSMCCTHLVSCALCVSEFGGDIGLYVSLIVWLTRFVVVGHRAADKDIVYT
jgi:hypothetical protein